MAWYLNTKFNSIYYLLFCWLVNKLKLKSLKQYWNFNSNHRFVMVIRITHLSSSSQILKVINLGEQVYFKSQILVHEYWTILDHFGVPVLFASGSNQHVLENVNITFSSNTGTLEMFQFSPILGCSSIWDLKYTFSHVFINLAQDN